MDYNNGVFVFEIILKDYLFMTYIDDYLNNCLFYNDTINSINIQSLLFIISSLIHEKPTYKIYKKNIKTTEDLYDLLYCFYDYILDKIDEIIVINELDNIIDKNEFKTTFDMSINLLLFNFKLKNKNKKIKF
jgi:hypothetical protein